MGVLFLASAIRNTLAGQFAGEIDPKNIATLPAQYSHLFSWSTLVGLAMLAPTPLLKRLIAGAKQHSGRDLPTRRP
jgi:hypothetical protein